MKHLALGLLTVLMTLLLTSCGRTDDPAGSDSQVWTPEFMPIELAKDSYGSIAFLGDAFSYLSFERQSDDFLYRLSGYSLTEGPLPDISLDWPDGGSRFLSSLFAMDGEGGIYLISYVTDESGSRQHLCKFDAKGNLLYDVDITEQTGDINLLEVDSQGRAYLCGSASDGACVWLYAADGAYRGAVLPDIANGGISAMGRGRNGVVYVSCYSNSGGGTSYFLSEIDFDRQKTGASYPDFPKGENSVLVPGMDDSLLSYDRTTIYAYDLTTRTGEALFDWLDYGINGSRVNAVHVQEDGSLLALIQNLADSTCELALLKKTDSAQAMPKETIVLGTLYSNTSLRSAVMEFNRKSDKYSVKIKEYLDPQTHDQAEALIRMNNDILSDACPDILDLSDLDLKALASKGLFVDLNAYLESSSLLDASDFLDNLLDAYTIGGKLIAISPRFSMKTVFGWNAETGRSSGQKADANGGWTLADLMAYADAHPDAEVFDNASRSEMMQYLMSYNEDAFIDWDLGECYFESDAFRELLTFVSRFPEEAEQNKAQSSTPVRIRNGEVLLLVEDIMEFNSIQLPLEIYENKGTCIGFPTADGSPGCMLIPYDAYAITVKSGQKDGAWAFIENFLASADSSSSFFPSRKDKLAEKAADAVNPEYLTDDAGELILDENGAPIPSDSGMGIVYSDWEYTYHIPTQEEVDLTLRLIETAKPVSLTAASEVITIINEEAQGYYQGQKTVEDVAKIIQSRVRIYVNED